MRSVTFSRKIFIWWLVWVLVPVAEAAIYRGRDAEGNVVYSDRPFPGAKEMDTPSPSRYTPPPLPQGVPSGARPTAQPLPDVGSEESNADDTHYQTVTILSPKHDENIHENNGNFALTVSLTPGLRKKHRLVALVDGERQLVTWNTTSMAVTGVERGTHKLSVEVLDESGNTVLGKSKAITFHMHRASANFKR